MILRSWRSWLLLVVLWPAVSGATVIELPADGRARAIDATEIEVLRDDTLKLDYPQVLSAGWADRFKTSAVSLNHGYDKAAWWYRAQLRAPAGDTQDWVVQLPVTALDHVDFYLQHADGRVQSVLTGYLRPPSSGQLRQRYYALPLTLPAGQTVQLHVRVQTDGSHHAPLYLWDAASFEAESGAENLWLGMAYGILLAMAGLNLMIGLWSRERVYLLYVGYIVSITLLQIWVNGYPWQYLHDLFGGSVGWIRGCLPALVLLTAFFAAHFVRDFLSTARLAPISDRFLQGLIWLMGASIVASVFMPFGVMDRFANLVAQVVSLTLLGIGFMLSLSGHRSARFFLLAWTVLLAGTMVRLLELAGLLPASAFTRYSWQIGSVLDVMLLTVALADRIAYDRRERSELQKIANASNERAMANLARYQRMVENVVEGIFETDVNGHFTTVNPAFAQMLGFASPAEFLARRPGKSKLSTEPEQMGKLVEILRKQGRVSNYEMPLLRSGGGVTWVSISGRAVRDAEGVVTGYDGIIADISERKQREADQRLHEVEQRVSQLTQALPGMVYQFYVNEDQKPQYSYITDGSLRLFGVAPADVMRDSDVLHSRIHEEGMRVMSQAFLHSMQDQKPLQIEFQVHHTDGRQLWLRTAASPGMIDGRFVWSGHTLDVTAEREARLRLEAAETRIRELTEALPGTVYQMVLTEKGEMRYGYLTDGATALFGIPRDVLMKDPFALPLRMPPEDRLQLATAFRDSIRTLQPARLDFRVRHDDGSIRWLRTSAMPRSDGKGQFMWNGHTMDVTAEREAQDQAASIQQRLTDVTENMPGAVFELHFAPERGLAFTFISGGIEALTGVTPQEVCADFSKLLGLIVPEDQAVVAGVIVSARTNDQALKVDCRYRHVSGDIRWTRITASAPRVSPDGQRWRSGSWQDITDIKQLQTELAAATEAAQGANRAKSDFLANMSHEIRTPMNAIIGLSQLAMRTELNLRQRDYLTKILGAAQSLLDIINDVLDLSKIEAGKLTVEQTLFDLNEVLDNLSGLMNLKAADKGLELLFSVESGVPYALMGDPLRLGQVLINLTNNAIKFTEKGQIVVRISLIEKTDRDCRLRFSITDSGIGLSEAQIARLFESYNQADTSTTRKYGGTGLGLAICKRLVELMGGDIRVSSVPGQGSTFEFTVRMGLSDSAVRTQPLELPHDLTRLRVLVVDDNAIARDILRSYLEGFGFRVELCESGVQAIARIRQEEDPFRLVVMDWQMPGMNGIEAGRRIKSMGLQPSPVVIMVSAYGREEIMRQAENARLEGFLIKPVNPSILLDTILQSFGREVAGGRSQRIDHQGAAELRGTQVLLVEDNEINQQVARELLESAGVSVTIANHGGEALECLQMSRFDAVLMDLQMPVMDGFEATQAIRALPQFKDLPIIAMTANVMASDRELCLKAGMNDHLPKPIDLRELYATLMRWVHLPELTASAVRPLPAEQEAQGKLIQLETALRRLGGNDALYRKLARNFVETQADPAEEVRRALAQDDLKTAVRAAHSVKGLAASLGADLLSAAAATVETALKRHEGDLQPLLDQLTAAWRAAVDELKTFTLGGDAEASAQGPVDTAELAPALRLLDQQLALDDAGAVRQAEAIRRMAPGALGLQELLRCANQYDFGKARAALRTLAESYGIDLGEPS